MDCSGSPRPNFLYIGPDKAGSTWIDRILRHHPQVGMGSAKETFYFDRYFHKGEGWYLRHFSKAVGFRVVGEVSHDYLFDPRCCERIARGLPDVRLMVCLREPAQRAFSAYLYMLRQGRPMGTFEAALDHCAELIDHGRYATHLEPYLAAFGRERLHLAVFDDLQHAPQAFADALFDFLGLDACRLPGDLLQKSLPAAAPRHTLMAAAAKKAALLIRQMGYPALVGRIKTWPVLQSILYRPWEDNEKPVPDEATLRTLRDLFRADVEKLDRWFGLGLMRRWDYGSSTLFPDRPLQETIALCPR